MMMTFPIGTLVNVYKNKRIKKVLAKIGPDLWADEKTGELHAVSDQKISRYVTFEEFMELPSDSHDLRFRPLNNADMLCVVRLPNGGYARIISNAWANGDVTPYEISVMDSDGGSSRKIASKKSLSDLSLILIEISEITPA